MDEREKERVRQWIRNWEATQPVLERLRNEAIRNTDTATAIEQLSDAFESARLHWMPPATSGLVERQRWFGRLRPWWFFSNMPQGLTAQGRNVFLCD